MRLDATNNATTNPSFETVYAYALKSTEHHIRRSARHLSREQKEDIMQISLLRCWKAFERLTPDLGWKSFIGIQCRGAVLDYIKGGSFEDGLGAHSAQVGALKTRIEIQTDHDDVMSVENTAGLYGIFNDDLSTSELFSPDWDLLSRLVCNREYGDDLHIICKMLYGHSQEKIAKQFAPGIGRTISRERISQRMYEFIAKLDAPEYLNNPWFNQVIFALGLSSHYNMKEVDNGVGHNLPSFDLQDLNSFKNVRRHFTKNLFEHFGYSDHEPKLNEMTI